jgi:hypothetical protein
MIGVLSSPPLSPRSSSFFSQKEDPMRTLSDGRQRRSRQEWKKIVDRFERSGLSENRFCKDHGLTRKTFRTWRKHFAEEGEPIATPTFVELAAPRSKPEGPPEPSDGASFELCLPGGVTLRWRT